MNIKISKNLQWLLPYIEEVQDLVNLKKIKRIKGFKVKPNCEEWTDAQVKIDDDKRYIITIKTHTQIFQTSPTFRSFSKYTPLTYAQVLDSLAHEMSHVKYWSEDHSPKHFEYQLKILKRFIKVMKKQGITDCWKKIPKG